MASRTYVVGTSNKVKRLDNIDQGNFIWTDKALSFSGNPFLFDVKCDPTNADKVFIVGRVSTTAPNPFPGIAFSLDGGTNWIAPAGTYPNGVNMTYYEIWPVDTNTIYACGKNGVVIKSTDGGYTFNQVASLPAAVSTSDIYSIHFYNANVGVIGIDGYVLKTINGGTSWSIQNGGQPILGIGQVRGIYMPNTQIIIACGSNWISRSINSGVTFPAVPEYAWVSGTGNHLTWFTSGGTTVLWAVGDNEQVVKSLDLGDTWQTLSAYNPSASALNYNAAIFYDTQTGFYGVNSQAAFGISYVQNSIAGPVTVPPGFQDLSVKNIAAVWTQTIPPSCYRLANCVTGVTYITKTDLSTLLGSSVRFSIINQGIVLPVIGCYEVNNSNTCLGAVEVQVNFIYNNCGECVNSCYLIQNCQDETDFFTSINPVFASYIGQYIEIEDCPDKCFFVTLTTDCNRTSNVGPGNILNVYSTCEECVGISAPDPFELHQRSIKPGFTTPGCPPDYTVKVNCNYGEQLYDEMVAIRYGINICCEHDVDKWDIKKQLLDLASIYDPNLCVSAIKPCDPPCNVAAFLQVFEVFVDQEACPEPTDVEGSFDIPPDSCPDPSSTGITVTFGYVVT